MSDPFVAEIRMLPWNFAPKGWAMCNGRLMPISQNTALFSLLGTNYGGDGRSTFALPDLSSRAPMHPGQGPGLSMHYLGDQGGEASVTLTPAQIPGHTHKLSASNAAATASTPGVSVLQGNSGSVPVYSNTAGTPVARAQLAPSGNNQPHNNMPPYLTLNFCIALQGVYPARS